MEHRRISIGPKDVLRLKKPTNGFLCPLSTGQDHGVDFLSFVIRDDESKRVLFEIGEDAPTTGLMEIDYDAYDDDDCLRAIKYTFSEDVLRLPVVSTSLTFKAGDQPLTNFRMIERHYFRKELVKSYDFSFGFVIPGSVNTWDAIYDLPPLREEIIAEMIAHPYETVSDSFYFVGNELIIHNKARYRYLKEEDGRGGLAIEDLSLAERGAASLE